MRLERAFLLEQLSKRMAADIDGSEGSDDGMTTVSRLCKKHTTLRRGDAGDVQQAKTAD